MATYEEIQRLLEQNRKEIGQRAADVPGIYNQYSPSNDSEIAAARSAQADKVRQLFDHDSKLSQVSFQPQAAPGPTVNGEAPVQPEAMILDPLIGLKAANTQTMETANEAIDLGQRISERKDFLSESLDKALKLFSIGMEIKKAEQAALQDEMNNYFKLEDLNLARSKAGSGSESKAALGELLSNVLKWQERKVAATPQATGVAKDRNALNVIVKKYPNETLDYTKNADGSYNWAIRKKDQTFLTDEEAATYNDQGDTLNKLLASFTALYPESKEDAATILSAFGEEKNDRFGTSVDEAAAGVAGMPKTADNLARWSLYSQWSTDPEGKSAGVSFNSWLGERGGSPAPGVTPTPAPQATSGTTSSGAKWEVVE